MIKYLGSKRLLVPTIVGTIAALPEVRTVLDLFSGTARVGHALKARGFRVLANDHNDYACMLARCYVQADLEDVIADAEKLIAELQLLPGSAGWFTEVYCERARYFQPKNGARIEAIRERIAQLGLEPELESVVLVSLLEAADRVDSTTGVQMAYLKGWAPRSCNDLTLRLPVLLPRAAFGKGSSFCLEALEAARSLEADVAYIDPPYNQHSYLGNYHVWETLVRWDAPSVYGVAQKRTDCRERKSAFNSKAKYHDAFSELIGAMRTKILVVSGNDEGFLPREAVQAILSTRGEVACIEHDYPRYVGARIGIYDPKGKKVGTISHLRNKELVYVVGPPELLDRAGLAERSSLRNIAAGTSPSASTKSQHTKGP